MRIHRAGVGKDDLITGFEAADDLDRVDGTAAEFNRRADRFRAARDEFENSNGVVLLAEGRTADVDDIIETLEFDRAVDAQVGARAFRQFAIEGDVHPHRPLIDRGIDAHDMAGDDAIASVDGGGLIDLNVFRLRFGDFDFGFQLRRIRDTGEIGTGDDALADFERKLLEHASEPGAHFERFHLVLFQLRERFHLIDRGLFRSDLRFNVLLREHVALLLDGIARGQVFRFDLRSLVGEVGDEAVSCQVVVRLGLHFRLLIFGVHAGRTRFLFEQVTLQRGA